MLSNNEDHDMEDVENEYEKEKIQKKYKNKDKNFEIILVDINETINNNEIICIKKKLYETNFNYVAISYRWGELDEQFISTPDYMACITSFSIKDFLSLCQFIRKKDEYNKDINYIWIDAICVNQKNYEKRKETIYRMSDIYNYSKMVICVPDLHIEYLKKNPMNEYILNKIRKYNEEINYIIINNYFIEDEYEEYQCLDKNVKYINQESEINIKNNFKKIKKCLKWIEYIIDDWIDRVWVISEFNIGIEKK